MQFQNHIQITPWIYIDDIDMYFKLEIWNSEIEWKTTLLYTLVFVLKLFLNLSPLTGCAWPALYIIRWPLNFHSLWLACARHGRYLSDIVSSSNNQSETLFGTWSVLSRTHNNGSRTLFNVAESLISQRRWSNCAQQSNKRFVDRVGTVIF